ncbi:Phosphoglycerate dehydrogenase [Asanoa hainanensis]|uniref:Phosphoglycerate dehydrogenase n=1 Tax=Asanoa hainanensis TaxID=560556 RepID=A0A239PB04_9ACTN|nr:D-2-hydroxyacid dehydrogenase [Asanoa hainanensis]SNT64063.1 Phosphoglycerate dehydrogenase [Asanoa hainanensis]
MSARLGVLIATYLEPDLVQRIVDVDPRIDVSYEPDIVPVPRYVCDHTGTPRELSPAQQDRWERALAGADVSFDFDWQAPADLPARAPGLRWVQATSAGIGGFVQRTGLDRTGLTFTTAAGIHAVPLAEFAVLGALHFVKGVPHLAAQQAAHRWQRYTTSRLAGRTVTVVGLGGIGRQVVASFAALGTRVLAVGRPGRDYPVDAAASVHSTDELDDLLRWTDVLVLCTPLTELTDGLLSAERIAKLKPGAIVVNIGRGQLLDETALVAALRGGALAGAALDVFATEPLPAESPLWDLPNVLVSPHSASTVDTENAAITDLFCENLRRYLDGRELRNVYQRELGY